MIENKVILQFQNIRPAAWNWKNVLMQPCDLQKIGIGKNI